MIRLRLLGTAELGRDGGGNEQLVVLQPKRFALIAYLGARPGIVHRRDTLLGLFWPELDADHARGALSKALHHIRRSLGETVLLSHGDDGLQVNGDVLYSDVAAFELAVSDARWEEAVGLYRGDLLPGFFLSGAPEFEHWLDQERDRLRRRAKVAAWALADAAAAADNPAGATEWARRAHAIDSEDEAGLRRLLAVLDGAGDRAGALRVFDEFSARLQREYDLEPALETIALVNQMRQPRAETGAQPHIRPSRPRRHSTPIPDSDSAYRATPDSTSNDPAAGTSGLNYAATLDGARVTPGSNERPASLSGIRQRAWHGTRAVAAASVILLGGLGYALLPRATLAPASDLQTGRGEPLLLVDFDAHGADPALAQALTVATRAALEQSESVSLISNAAAVRTLDQMQHPAGGLALDAAREVAVRAGARAVVHGGVTAVGGRFVLALRLIEAESGNTLVTLASHAGTTVELLPAIDQLTRELRTRIGESLRQVRATLPLERVTTPSFDALQKYTAAYRAHYTERDFEKAVQLLEEAVALDSGFAMAWRQLAVSSGSAGMEPGRRQTALEAAFRFRERASPPERDLIVSTWYLAARDRPRAAAAHEAVVMRDPTNVQALHALAGIYLSRRNAVAAESLYRKVIAIDAGHVVAHSNLILSLWMQERLPEAEKTVRAALDRFPGDPVLAMREADLHWFQGNLDRYERSLDRLRTMERTEARRYGLRTRSDLALMRGRLRVYRELRTEARESGLLFPFETPEHDSLLEARIHAVLRGQQARAVEVIEAAVMRRPESEAGAEGAAAANAFSLAGRPDRARRVLQLSINGADTSLLRKEQPALEASRGWIALAEGRHRDAVTHFRRSDMAQDGPVSECRICLPLYLGLAFDAMGQADTAIAMYEIFLRPSIHGRGFIGALYRGHVFERLGRLHEAQGNLDRAISYNARLIDLWKDADPELQPRVTAARMRNAQLRSRNGTRG